MKNVLVCVIVAVVMCVMPICAVPPPLEQNQTKQVGEPGLTYNASAFDPRRTCYRGYTYFYPQGCSTSTIYRLYLCGNVLRLMYAPSAGCYQIDLKDYGDFSLMSISGGYVTRCRFGFCPTKKSKKAIRTVANYDQHYFLKNGNYNEYLYLSDTSCAPNWYVSPSNTGRALVFSSYSDCYN
jgi:hypothetical protein